MEELSVTARGSDYTYMGCMGSGGDPSRNLSLVWKATGKRNAGWAGEGTHPGTLYSRSLNNVTSFNIISF